MRRLARGVREISILQLQMNFGELLDTIDFMPIATANYSGGILITDWYSDNDNLNESIKISIRFLTNEVRSDALSIKIFYKKCENIINCKIIEQQGNLKKELQMEILRKAALYAKETKKKTSGLITCLHLITGAIPRKK